MLCVLLANVVEFVLVGLPGGLLDWFSASWARVALGVPVAFLLDPTTVYSSISLGWVR